MSSCPQIYVLCRSEQDEVVAKAKEAADQWTTKLTKQLSQTTAVL